MNTFNLVLINLFILFIYVMSKPLIPVIEKYKNEASCKYDVKLDVDENRIPKTITHLECSSRKFCECVENFWFNLTKIQKVVPGKCVQLTTNIQVSYNNSEVTREYSVNYGCVCAPDDSGRVKDITRILS